MNAEGIAKELETAKKENRRINLYGADLCGANLRNANLSYANLRYADLRNANLYRANPSYADLSGADLGGANLSGANLYGANLYGVNLRNANLSGTTLWTGEKWESYLAEVVPALLIAGGRALRDFVTKDLWACHTWQNCPMAEAFKCQGIDGVPILLRPRAQQFVQLFDAGLIPMPGVK